MDLADLTRDLEALRADALAAIEAAPDTATLDALELDVLGKKGRLTDGPARDRGASRRGPAEGRCRRQRGPRRDRGGPRRARRGAAGHGARGAPRRRGGRRHDARPADPPGHAPPEHRGDARDRRDLRAVRVRDLREPRDRGRPDQLPDAQHPARPPGARPVGHALRRRRGQAPADAHLARPDPGDACGAPTDPGAPAGPLLPLRGHRRQPRLRVLPGRGPDDRRRHDDGRPEGPARPVRQGDVRGGQADPLPAGLLPVHRAVGGLRRRVPGVRRRPAARPAVGPAG